MLSAQYGQVFMAEILPAGTQVSRSSLSKRDGTVNLLGAATGVAIWLPGFKILARTGPHVRPS